MKTKISNEAMAAELMQWARCAYDIVNISYDKAWGSIAITVKVKKKKMIEPGFSEKLFSGKTVDYGAKYRSASRRIGVVINCNLLFRDGLEGAKKMLRAEIEDGFNRVTNNEFR